MSKFRSVAMLLVVFAMVAAACGSDTTSTTAGDSTDTTAAAGSTDTTMSDEPMEDVTLRVLIHQNPAFTEYMEQFNTDFEAAHPGVTVDMSVVDPGDMGTVIQTRLTANDVDVIDYCVAPCAGFSNAIQPYMTDVDTPTWQQLIEAGLIMDITDEPFVQNFDEASIKDAATYNDRVYAINMGRVSYSGMFVNTDLLADVGVDMPTTWSELVAVCEAVVASGNECMTLGGADGWPIFVGAYGLLGAVFPDQAALTEGLWTGDIKWNEGKGIELYEKYETFATEMLESGVTGLGHNEATARYAAGDVAFMPTGVWQAPVLEEAAPDFDWTYVPFPGSDTAADNQYLFGKYDMSWMISADTPHPDVATSYLAALADPDNYQTFVDAVGFLPTQPTATLNSKLGEAVAPLLGNYRVGFEQYWVAPKGVGQWANGGQAASWFAPFNEWTDATELANQSQADLEAGLGS
ncbi:MAG: extracellular solute-binding protein [Acidimicrobiia bacterium]|nr:extracellular solute-binding protein [Acidimicrobiia bacterium]